MPSRSAAVFLDRDGTLNRCVVRDGKPYPPSTVDEFSLLDGVAAGCAQLRAAGFSLVVVTNQPDVGRGTQKRVVVEGIHTRLREQVPEIELIQVCYHGGADHGQPCECRKPKPAMVLEAATLLDLDLGRSWMIGDRWRDIDCGHAAGCRTIFIDWSYSEVLRMTPDYTVKSFGEAVGIILAHA